MSDDTSSLGGDILKAVFAVAAVAALQAGVNALMAGSQKGDGQANLLALKQPIPPAIIHVGDYYRFAPAYAFYESKGDTVASVQLRNDGRIDSIAKAYLGDDWVTYDANGWVTAVNGVGGDGRYVDQKVRLLFRAGHPTETAFSEITSKWPDLWTAAHRGDGTASVAYICIAPKAKFQSQAFPVGRAELSLAQRAVCYDWRDGTQARLLPETWKASANPVVWLVHLETQRWGLDWDRQVAPVLADLTAQAAICDEPVALAAGGTEPRYRLAGAYRDNEDWDSVRRKILKVMDGYRSLNGRGQLVVRAGKYQVPTVTLTDKDITSVEWQTGIATERRVGRLQVFYMSPAADYTRAQCDDWVIDEDSPVADDFDAEWCPSFSQARRLAARYAYRLQAAGQGSIETNIAGLKAWGQNIVAIKDPGDPDMADIEVEIPDGIEMAGLGGFSFVARRIGPDIEQWIPALHEGADPGSPQKDVQAPLSAPTIQSATAFYDGTNIRLTVLTTGPDRADLTWGIRWRVTGGTSWNEAVYQGAIDLVGGQVSIDTGVVTPADSLDVQSFYITGSGAPSPYSVTKPTSGRVFPVLREDYSNLLRQSGAPFVREA